MHPPIRQLLVPVDLSAGAERAIKPARRVAGRTGVPVILFTWVFEEGIPEEAASAKRYLLDLAGHLPGPTTVEVVVTEDPGPAPSIAAAAERAGATVCMASHGRHGVGRAFLGSVAEETLRLLRQPSLLIGPHVTTEPIGPTTGIVACVDGTPLSERVLPVACSWAEQLHVPLRLVNVLEPIVGYGPPDANPDDVHCGYLAGIAAGLDREKRPDYSVLHDDPAKAIAEFAGTRAELIAVATHGRGGISRAVLGSVAMQVVHRARRPVLVVPPPRSD